MSKRRAGIMAGTAAAVAALTLSGASLAMAQSGTAPPETVPGGATSQTTSRDESSHTPVTGAEADAVIAAVVAVDADAVITEVRMDPDGSYDALGTSGDADVFYDVSADLASVTAGGGRGGHDGNGSRSDRPSDRPGAARGQDGGAATRTAPSAGANP